MKVFIVVLALTLAVAVQAQFPRSFSSGYIEVDKSVGANLFYYFVPSQSNPATDPVILWLQGGPGCSSMFGSFVENGPFVIQSNGQFKENPYTWNKNASMLWIDSPVGTGFSYVSGDNYPSDEKTIANDLYNALNAFFFTIQPQYAKNPFYIFGESYGGKYVPWLGSTVLANNKKASNKINLKGIGIGNGWVNPLHQTGSYAPYLYRQNKINYAELEAAEVVYLSYEAAIEMGFYEVAMVIGNDLLNSLMLAGGIGDVYDIRQASDPTDPLADKLTTALNNPTIRAKLNVTNNIEWGLCDTAPYYALTGDIDQSSEELIPAILSEIPVLLYNGNYDLICNMDGTAAWSDSMVWPGQAAFRAAASKQWKGPTGAPAGDFKTANGLTRVVVYNAGHMSPFDQPANVQTMVWMFLTGSFKQSRH